jgi:hypothetical protein
MKFVIWGFLGNLSRKFKFRLNLARTTGTLHEDIYTFIITSRWILFRMIKYFRWYLWRKNKHFMLNEFIPKSCRVWDNVEKHGRTRPDGRTDITKLIVAFRNFANATKTEVTGDWRKLHNEELYDLFFSQSTFQEIKLQSIRGAGNVARMG